MKKTFLLTLLLVLIAGSVSREAKADNGSDLSFRQWLFEYIPLQYPNAQMTDHGHWLQAHIDDELVVSWTQWNEKNVTMKYLESHALTNGKTIFIEKANKTHWSNHPSVTYIEGAGYFCSRYESSAMSSWKVEGCNILQFDGNAKQFTERMANKWAKVNPANKTNLKFRQWLFEYIPSKYSNASMNDHGHWLQAHVGDNLVVSWTQWNEQDVTLKYLESHALKNGRSIFIEKAARTSWANHPAVTYIDGAGYYIEKYDSATMSSWKVQGCNIIQFDGEAKEFTEKMAQEWVNAHSFKWWLYRYLPARYPNAKMHDHRYWLQSFVSDELVVNWTEWTDEDSTLKAMEAHDLKDGEAIFIEQKGPKKDWAKHLAVLYYPDSGYYITSYDPASMGSWDCKGLSVIQFNGDSKDIVKKIAKAWAATPKITAAKQANKLGKSKPLAKTTLPFRRWLFEYIPTFHSEAIMTDHGHWLQAHIGDDLVVSWTQWNEKNVTLKYLESHALMNGKAVFIEKGNKTSWANHPGVLHFEGAGYLCSSYDSGTMSNWKVEGCNIVQFDGDARKFVVTMAKAWSDAQPTLKELFANDFLIGGAYNHNIVSGKDHKAAAIAAKHLNTATSENDMKWANIHPQPDKYNWGPADDFMSFCEKHKMVPIGHTLVWKSQVPGWVFSDDSGKRMTREALLVRMEDHITQVVGRYKGRIKGWDVVNEALNEDGTIRRDNWHGIISEGKESQKYDHIEYAFRYAHAVDPDAELYYNDYNLDTKRKKCDGAIKIVKHLQSKGVRIDGVGIQLHAGLQGDTYPQVEDLEYAITELAALGVKVMVTELDIKTKRSGYRGADVSVMNRHATKDANANSQETQKMLADKYSEIFTVLLKHKKDITRVTLWGVHDAMSWISGSPLLFDKDCQPKEAFYSVINTRLQMP